MCKHLTICKGENETMSRDLTEEEVGIPDINFAYGVNAYVVPPRVQSARRGFFESSISKLDLIATEDSAVIELARKQKEAGLGVICDGTLRWGNNPIAFFAGFDGVHELIAPPGPYFSGDLLSAKSVALDGPIGGSSHPVITDFRILNTQANPGVVAKPVLFAPSLMLAELMLGAPRKKHMYQYPSRDAMADALVEAYRTILDELYTVGCRYVQFDDSSWNDLADQERYEGLGIEQEDAQALCALYASTNKRALEKIPHDMAICWRIVREDYHTTARYEKSYAEVAPYFFDQENVCAFSVPQRDASDDLSWLSQIPRGARLVLELASTRDEECIDERRVSALVENAARYVERDLIGIALGFESNIVDEGKPHACHCHSQEELDDTPDKLETAQWHKISELAEAARKL